MLRICCNFYPGFKITDLIMSLIVCTTRPVLTTPASTLPPSSRPLLHQFDLLGPTVNAPTPVHHFTLMVPTLETH